MRNKQQCSLTGVFLTKSWKILRHPKRTRQEGIPNISGLIMKNLQMNYVSSAKLKGSGRIIIIANQLMMVPRFINPEYLFSMASPELRGYSSGKANLASIGF